MPLFPLRKYFPMMHGSSIDEEDIAADTILEGDIADGAITTDKLANNALDADVDGRAKMATNFFDVATLLAKFASNSFTEANVLATFAAGAFTTVNLDALIADNQFTLALMNNLMVEGALADDRLVSFLVKEPGHIAKGMADFAGVADAGITVTVGAVVFQEAGAEDFPNGVWTNGGSGNDSAVSLAAAINGDTRNGGIYAAVVSTDTVFIFNRVVGTIGNVNIVVSANEPGTVENLVGGTDAVVKQQAHIMHTVTALEVAVVGAAPQVLIPLPFNATFFSWQVYDSTGGIYATELTARGTVTNAAGSVPAFFHLADNGAADVTAGDIIRLIIQD